MFRRNAETRDRKSVKKQKQTKNTKTKQKGDSRRGSITHVDARGSTRVHVCHVRCWSQVSVMCDDHYCHTPAPLLQLTLPMQMSLIASPMLSAPPPTKPPLPPSRRDDVHLLDLIKVMREREGGMDGGELGNWG